MAAYVIAGEILGIYSVLIFIFNYYCAMYCYHNKHLLNADFIAL